MEQYITVEQYNELSSQAQERFQAWFESTFGYNDDFTPPQPTVGQMIAFLDEYDNDELAFRLHLLIHPGTTRTGNKWQFDTGALAHSLWEGVKTVLMREEHNA